MTLRLYWLNSMQRKACTCTLLCRGRVRWSSVCIFCHSYSSSCFFIFIIKRLQQFFCYLMFRGNQEVCISLSAFPWCSSFLFIMFWFYVFLKFFDMLLIFTNSKFLNFHKFIKQKGNVNFDFKSKRDE